MQLPLGLKNLLNTLKTIRLRVRVSWPQQTFHVHMLSLLEKRHLRKGYFYISYIQVEGVTSFKNDLIEIQVSGCHELKCPNTSSTFPYSYPLFPSFSSPHSLFMQTSIDSFWTTEVGMDSGGDGDGCQWDHAWEMLSWSG